MSIHIGSCAAETIVVRTGSSVYELVVLRGDCGDVLVRGGSYFQEFRRVQFLGSSGPVGSLEPGTIEIGSRMRFLVNDQMVVTSPVQSLSRDCVRAASTEYAAAR